ncbi:MAG TPA: hypothetical protein VLJ42_12855 [Solirubrobacteraceae bacterium]|nr:hypothetical protein [Solirubrobacteraceae bacterium]
MPDSDDDLIVSETQLAATEAAHIGGDSGRPAGEDPADRAVLEAGGGVSEGFEEAEFALIDHAEHGDLGHSPRNDAYKPEVESDLAGAEYGEADQTRLSEETR